MRHFLIATLMATLPTGLMAGNVQMTVDNDQRCITSNGLPDHQMGRFPNRGNPHSPRAQAVDLCVDATPSYSGVARETPVVGIAKNGVLIRPGTADFYDSNSARGFSRNGRSGWKLDGKGAGDMLGLDHNNAHVDHRGLYHYHAVPDALTGSDGTLIGWAADGFEIHYLGATAKSGYRLKSGNRPSGPGGSFDGTYIQDWEYVAGEGNLDECNGGMLNGTYTYFATDTYPYFPHCLKGESITRIR